MFAARNFLLVGTTPPPTFVSISPSSGAAGTAVTITGTNFVPGSTTVTIGGVSTTATVTSSTSLTCTVPSAGARGAKSVVITTPNGSATGSNVFTLLTPPTFTSISPTLGGSGTSVTITGTNFLSGVTVSIGGSSASNVVRVSSTSITCTVPALATGGAKTVTITTADGSVTSGAVFTFHLAPTLTAVSPTSFKTGDTLTLTGTNFVSGNTSVAFSNGSSATNVSVASATSLTCTVPSISAGQSLAMGATVTTPGGSASTAPTALTYYPVPTYSSVSVPQGKAGLVVTVTGTGFSGTVTATVGGVSATVSVSSPTSLNLTIPTISTEGAKSIVITTPGGSVTGTNVFTYYNSYSAVTTAYTIAGSGTYTIPVWANYVDVICVGGGQGGGNAVGVGIGIGGNSGSWNGATLSRSNLGWGVTSLSYTVGAAGTGSTVDGANGNPGGSSSGGTVTAAGGSGGNGTSNTGKGAGNYVFNSVTYVGGADANNAAGNPPGGGGYGGTFGGNGFNGARGQVWFVARQ